MSLRLASHIVFILMFLLETPSKKCRIKVEKHLIYFLHTYIFYRVSNVNVEVVGYKIVIFILCIQNPFNDVPFLNLHSFCGTLINHLRPFLNSLNYFELLKIVVSCISN